jgi:hypothetical protein
LGTHSKTQVHKKEGGNAVKKIILLGSLVVFLPAMVFGVSGVRDVAPIFPLTKIGGIGARSLLSSVFKGLILGLR